MKNNETKHRRLLITLAIFTLCFIWGNSLLPASVSGAISGWLKDLLNGVFAGSHGGDMSGDGVLRKIAHATEFAVLGVELMLLFDRKLSCKLFLCGLGTALIDETIQLFVDGRAGLIKDVWIDCAGFILGCSIVLLIAHLSKRQKSKGTKDSR